MQSSSMPPLISLDTSSIHRLEKSQSSRPNRAGSTVEGKKFKSHSQRNMRNDKNDNVERRDVQEIFGEEYMKLPVKDKKDKSEKINKKLQKEFLKRFVSVGKCSSADKFSIVNKREGINQVIQSIINDYVYVPSSDIFSQKTALVYKIISKLDESRIVTDEFDGLLKKLERMFRTFVFKKNFRCNWTDITFKHILSLKKAAFKQPFDAKFFHTTLERFIENDFRRKVLLMSISKVDAEANEYFNGLLFWTSCEFDNSLGNKVILHLINYQQMEKLKSLQFRVDDKLLKTKQILKKISFEQIKRSINPDGSEFFLFESFYINDEEFTAPNLDKSSSKSDQSKKIFTALFERLYKSGLSNESDQLSNEKKADAFIEKEVDSFLKGKECFCVNLLRVLSINFWNYFDQAFKTLFPALYIAPFATRVMKGIDAEIKIISSTAWEVSLLKKSIVYPHGHRNNLNSYRIDSGNPLLKVTLCGTVTFDMLEDYKMFLTIPEISFLEKITPHYKEKILRQMANPNPRYAKDRMVSKTQNFM